MSMIRMKILNNIQSERFSDFTSIEIPIDTIIQSLTRLNFELIDDKKNTNIPQTIILNHLLNVKQTNQYQKK